jgi:hypothetical protein
MKKASLAIRPSCEEGKRARGFRGSARSHTPMNPFPEPLHTADPRDERIFHGRSLLPIHLRWSGLQGLVRRCAVRRWQPSSGQQGIQTIERVLPCGRDNALHLLKAVRGSMFGGPCCQSHAFDSLIRFPACERAEDPSAILECPRAFGVDDHQPSELPIGSHRDKRGRSSRRLRTRSAHPHSRTTRPRPPSVPRMERHRSGACATKPPAPRQASNQAQPSSRRLWSGGPRPSGSWTCISLA